MPDDDPLPKILTLLDVLSVQVGSVQADVGTLKSDVGACSRRSGR